MATEARSIHWLLASPKAVNKRADHKRARNAESAQGPGSEDGRVRRKDGHHHGAGGRVEDQQRRRHPGLPPGHTKRSLCRYLSNYWLFGNNSIPIYFPQFHHTFLIIITHCKLARLNVIPSHKVSIEVYVLQIDSKPLTFDVIWNGINRW